jgi:hypothetical protein
MIFKVGVDWIHVARDRDNWEDLVKAIMDFQTEQNVVDFSNS